MIQTPLKKSHVVVTGGSKGIGLAVAKKLAELGCTVSLISRHSDALDLAKAELEAKFQSKVYTIAADVSKEADVARAFESIRITVGPVNILINNVGAAESAPLVGTDLGLWQRMLDTNLTSAFLCSKIVLPEMIVKKHGKIVSIASSAGLMGFPYVAAYCAAKHGLVGFTRALALEVKQHGISVNAVCPAYTETELLSKSIQEVSKKTGRSVEEVKAGYLQSAQQSRFLQPEEVAASVVKLCLPDQANVTGEAILLTPDSGGV